MLGEDPLLCSNMTALAGSRKDGIVFNRQTNKVYRLLLFHSYDELMKYQLARAP